MCAASSAVAVHHATARRNVVEEDRPPLVVRARAAGDGAARVGLGVLHLSAPRNATHTLSGHRAVLHAGVDVPSRMTVAGVDDLPALAEWLATVRQSLPGLAPAALRLREEAVAGAPARKVVVPVELRVRGT